ncbi:hypothetical protein [Aquabacterium sp.]|uniref:hypothetical protein n=1 Tax=Aquabacterium sp. TaxID=1872578 RepID=UPI002C08BD80|nr:hypothetical protein [Aquabacterium sp.]HSW06943.1 hypothetical protein [Aquabacterium sp.]
MSHRPASHSTPTTEQAAALIAEVERTLAEGQQQLRSMGLDPAKVRALGQALTPAQQQQADNAVRQDLAAVDQEVAEAQARLRAAEPAAGGPSKARRFI